MWKQIKSKHTSSAKNFRRIAKNNGIDHVIVLESKLTQIEAIPPRLSNKKRKKWARETEELIDRICEETKSYVSNKRPTALMEDEYIEVACGSEVFWKIASKHQASCIDCGHLLAPATNVKYTAGQKTEKAAQEANDQNAVAPVITYKPKTEIYMDRGEEYIRTVKEDVPEKGIWTGDIPEDYSRHDLVAEIDALEDRIMTFWENIQNRSEAVAEQLIPLRKFAESVTDAEEQLAELEREQAEINAKRDALMKELGV